MMETLSFNNLPKIDKNMDDNTEQCLHKSNCKELGFGIKNENEENANCLSQKNLNDSSGVRHLAFLLDCFVLSFGPQTLQLGRNHPESEPEKYAFKPVENEDADFKPPIQHRYCSMLPFEDLPFLWRSSSSTDDGSSFDMDDFFLTRAPSPLSYTDDDEGLAPIQNEGMFREEYLIRELSDMRILIERLLELRHQGEWNADTNIRDVLSLLPDAVINPREPSPHYPVGELEFQECGICFEYGWFYLRECCNFPSCNNCLKKYFSQKVDLGQVKIECCNATCNSYVHRDEISACLDPPLKEKFHRLLILSNDRQTKTCPKCNHVTKLEQTKTKLRDVPKSEYRITCPSCQLVWCFVCHAPWHEGLTCKQFRKGDKLLRTWAKERNHGQLNAQKCPKCKIYIQRTTGCDHMHCTRCKTDFCYRCGDKFRRLKFFGDHYSKLSVFGCKFRYKADKPMQRKLVRGAIFGSKMMAAPVLGTLALCAGALAVGVGLFALPVYGGVKLYRRCEAKRQAKSVVHLTCMPTPLPTPMVSRGDDDFPWEII